MKYFGIERVIEPVGAIPPTAWRLDNSREVRPGEMRLAVEVIKLEGDNFNQICSDCQYNESRIKERILTIIKQEGKASKPVHRKQRDAFGDCRGGKLRLQGR